MKGLILAAGYGTRFLPVTKTIPKEMLPLLDKPSIAFIVDEFIASGIEDIVIITSRRKKALEDYFDREMELESVFTAEGALNKLVAIKPPEAHFTFIRQQKMLGTGHALLTTRAVIGQEPFVVAYPDDLHFGVPPLARQLIDTHKETGCTVLSTIHNPVDLERYGILDIDPDGFHVKDIVEKPAPGTAPSKEATIGRYLYTPEIFEFLEEGWKKHTGGEYYHTYALKKLMYSGQVVYRQCVGERLDTGTPAGYLRAILKYAATVPEYREVLDEFSKQYG